MKKNIEIICAALFVVCGIFASCAKENTPDDKSSGEKTYIVNFIGTIKSEEPQDISKTGFVPVGDKQQIWWKKADTLTYIQYFTNPSGEQKFQRAHKNVEGEGFVPEVKHSVSFSVPKSDTPVSYSSFFPKGSYVSFSNNKVSGKHILTLQTPKKQCPSENNFDPQADLLFSEQNGFEPYTSNPKTFSLKYYRKVAIARMKVYGLPTDEAVDSIMIRATKGGASVALAGQTKFNPENSVDTYGGVKKETTLTLDYSGKSIKASGEGMTAFFCCYPFELSEGDKLQIIVQTASHLYCRNITLSEEQSLKLEAGQATNFSVNMESSTLAVAKLGSSLYSSFESAVTAANKKTTESTLTLLENITLTSTVSFTNTNAVTLDLNGKTIDCGSLWLLKVDGGNLVVDDSATNGAIKSSSSCAVYSVQKGTTKGVFTLKNGSISNTTNDAIYASNSTIYLKGGSVSAKDSSAVVLYRSTVEIDGASISSDQVSQVTQAVQNVNVHIGALAAIQSEVTISSGSIKNSTAIALYSYASQTNPGTINISGGTVTGRFNAVYPFLRTTLNISNGNLESTYSTSETNSRSSAVYTNCTSSNGTEINISGGYFKTSSPYIFKSNSKTSGETFKIKGGHFNIEPFKDANIKVAEGYQLNEDSDIAYPYYVTKK